MQATMSMPIYSFMNFSVPFYERSEVFRGAGMAQWWECSPPTMCPGFDSLTRRHMWADFVVGSLLCSKGYSGFPLSLKTYISKFQFDPGMHGLF